MKSPKYIKQILESFRLGQASRFVNGERKRGKQVSSEEFWRGYDKVWKSGPPTRLKNPDNVIDPSE